MPMPARDGVAWLSGSSTGLPLDADLAAVGLVEAVEDRHQRRLAGAVLADDAVDCTLAHLQRDVLVGLDRTEALGNADEFDGQRSICARVDSPRLTSVFRHVPSHRDPFPPRRSGEGACKPLVCAISPAAQDQAPEGRRLTTLNFINRSKSVMACRRKRRRLAMRTARAILRRCTPKDMKTHDTIQPLVARRFRPFPPAANALGRQRHVWPHEQRGALRAFRHGSERLAGRKGDD